MTGPGVLARYSPSPETYRVWLEEMTICCVISPPPVRFIVPALAPNRLSHSFTLAPRSAPGIFMLLTLQVRFSAVEEEALAAALSPAASPSLAPIVGGPFLVA